MKKSRFEEPVLNHARKDFPTLSLSMNVGEALDSIRKKGVGERIIYFYVVDEAGRLAGVIPTRKMLVATLDQKLTEIMLTNVVTIPETATVMEAHEYFVLHRFLAFPVVDGQKRMVGLIDVNQFAEGVFDLTEREQADSAFEAIGFRVHQVRDANPVKAFRYRIPWLMATVCSGTCCAVLTGAFEHTLAKSLIIAFFLALVLGLAESMSMQSMTVAIQNLRVKQLTFGMYLKSLFKEWGTSILLGLVCATSVAVVVAVWKQDAKASFVIGASIGLSLQAACFFGLSVPWLLHSMKLDPKIAAGPLALAGTDIATLLIYFCMASSLL